MKAIHVIQKDPNLLPKPVEPGSEIHTSGFWTLSEARAAELVDGDIYFHKKQAAPSFFGGRITGYEVCTDAPWCGRIIFRFGASPDHKGRTTGKEGWAQVIKIVDD